MQTVHARSGEGLRSSDVAGVVRAKGEAGYTATRFIQMLSDHGGVKTAKTLLASPSVSDGFTALWEAGRPDLTVEYQVLQPQFRSLFTQRELESARQRLLDYGLPESEIPSARAVPALVDGKPDAHAQVLHKMGTLAVELGLSVKDTQASRKYRRGRAGPSAWVQRQQGRLYFDLRTFRRASVGSREEVIRASLQALTTMSVNPDMASIPFDQALARWDELETKVIRPFFEPADSTSTRAATPGSDTMPEAIAAKTQSAMDEALASGLQDQNVVLLEISARRNAIETRLREVLSQGLRYAHGSKAGAALVGCLQESRRPAVIGKSYDSMWEALYFKELRDIMNKEWAAFARWFAEDKDNVLMWMDHVNRFRADAHSKSISDDDLAYLRVCFRRLEETLDIESG